MNQLLMSMSCKKKYLRSIRGLSLIVLVIFLVACQPAQTKTITVDNRKVHNGVLGIKAKIENKTNMCAAPVKISRKHYGRLSSRSRRRQLYDYVTGIRQKVYGYWLKPKGVAESESCSVLIWQRIDGCVRKVSFKNCRHYRMRTTVRRAVMKASPLPQAPHPALYSSEILLNFKLK